MWGDHQLGTRRALNRHKERGPNYDVFLSLAGPDRPRVEALNRELGKLGLRVFVDVDIQNGAGITHNILDSLYNSRALVAYYSKHFTHRPASQKELLEAFLAGQQKGDPCQHIIVINPDDPDSSHIWPQELADAKYLPDSPDTDAKVCARQIAERLESMTEFIRPTKDGRPDPFWNEPDFFGTLRGRADFAGRFPELWRLHSALVAHRFPLTAEKRHGSYASVTGEAGIGKTALVAAYTYGFAKVYPGGIFWTRIGNDIKTEADALDQHAASVKSWGSYWHSYTDSSPISEVKQPALFVIDDIPPHLMPGIAHKLIPPSPLFSAIFITREANPDTRNTIPTLPLGPLQLHEAQTLLELYQPTYNNESNTSARDELIKKLGCKPGTLSRVGAELLRHSGMTYSLVLDNIASVMTLLADEQS